VQPSAEQRQRPAQTPPAPAQTQSSQRFVIEDLALDDDEEDHTKKKAAEKTQFSSLLRRFRPKNS